MKEVLLSIWTTALFAVPVVDAVAVDGRIWKSNIQRSIES